MASNPPGSPPAPNVRPPLWMIFGVTVTGILGNTLIPPALPDLLADFGAPDWQAGLVLTAATVPGIVLAPVIGVLADRFGRREVLVPCLVTFGAFGLLGALAPTMVLLLVCRLFQGMGAAGLINLAVVLIADHWDGEERARLIGKNAAVLTVSIAVVPPLGGLLTDLGGWRWSFAPYALAFVTAAAALRILRPAVERRNDRFGAQLRAALPVLRRPPVVRTLAVGTLVFVLIFGLVLTVLPLHLERRFGLAPTQIGFMLGLPALSSTAVALNVGRIRRRVAPASMVLAGLLLIGGAFAVVASTTALVIVALGVLLYGAGEGLLIPTMQDGVAAEAPADQRGVIIAVWVGFVRLGQALGPAIGGAALSTYGARAAFAAAATVAVLAALAGGLVRQRPRVPDRRVADR